MATKSKQRKILRLAIVALATAFCGHAATAQAGGANAKILQQVGYAGQVSQTVTGQFPVTVRLFNTGDALVYEETITADIQKGRFQIYVGGGQADLRSVLKDSQQMKVFFAGNLLDSLPVVHASQVDVLNNMKQYSGIHAVVVTDTNASGVVPQALAGTCSILQSGFFTIPFTNTTVGTTTPSCGASVAVSGGYFFITTPAQGVIPFGLLPPALTNWQVNYQVGATAATVQTYTVCCP
jgi:hypothetical protein